MNAAASANPVNNSLTLNKRLEKKIGSKNRLLIFTIIESMVLLILFPGFLSFFPPLYDVFQAIHTLLADLFRMLTDLLLQKLDENGYDIREEYQRFLELVNLAAGRPETPYIITLLLTIPYIRLIFRYAEILRLKHKMRPPRPKAVPVPAASRDDGNNTETFRNTGKRNVKKRRTPKAAVRMPRISFTTLLPLPIRVWRNLSLCIFRKKIAGTAMEFPDGGYLRVQKLGPHDQQDRKNESICSWNTRNVIEIPADINEEGEDCIKFCYKDDRAFIVVSEDGKYLYHPLEKNVPLLLVKNIRELRNPQDDIPNYAVTWICGTAEGSAAGKER